ncbi:MULTISPECIES: FimB/Mfa2 family fimbrial subunit [Bacteroides]|jgi:hypothetical protein|uniref:FimB/Mfa2 family fimbrial subunit n=1 Tax=Bacteroides TaxID=816 RepID=UPI000E4440BA|nr:MULTISPECIES: FimB/Mfa2 family fimbrial subunit [Bacteroides]MBS7574627.1 FimB/Mfa2 family fimbrial subunit [Bacteroides propionicigenes]RGM23777.1 hypothetical protein DXC20_16940 [Bacteroides sp. OM08-17BH]
MKRYDLYNVIVVAALSLSLASCVKDELYNTPHPDKGAVQITADWTKHSAEALMPDLYVLRIGHEEQTVRRGEPAGSETTVFRSLFLPGVQNLLAYNPAEGFGIDGDIASVNTLADGTLHPLPGFLFSAAGEVEVLQDDTLKVALSMQQRICALKLTLKLASGDEQRIVKTAATLTGVVSAINLRSGAVAATEGATTAPVFTLTADAAATRAESNPVLTAVLHLLGVMPGEKQQLTMAVTLTDGSVQTVVTDLTGALKGFGGDGKEALALDATLALPDGSSSVETATVITDWTPGNGEAGESGDTE